jgi:hypothetical protein
MLATNIPASFPSNHRRTWRRISKPLSLSVARPIKESFIRRFCEGEISAEAVTLAFEIFPELKSA